MTSATDIDDIRRISRDTDAWDLAVEVYRDLESVLGELSAAEWAAPTDCVGWNVADMTGHLIGAAKAHASLREQVRQLRHGGRHKDEFGGNETDAMNALQVADHVALSPDQRLAALRARWPKAVAGRRRLPGPLTRVVPIPIGTTGSFADGSPDTITLASLLEVVLTRDVWLHRIDITRATGKPLTLRAEVDARIVADIVTEWARRHEQPFDLTLTGTAGGRYTQGDGGPAFTHDAIEFCRAMSGRSDGIETFGSRVMF